MLLPGEIKQEVICLLHTLFLCVFQMTPENSTEKLSTIQEAKTDYQVLQTGRYFILEPMKPEPAFPPTAGDCILVRRAQFHLVGSFPG